MLAWGSWSELFLGALAGALLGAVYAQVLSAKRVPGGRVYLPLGPFLLLGAFAAIALLPCRLPFDAFSRIRMSHETGRASRARLDRLTSWPR
jgi:hypothetical protein